MTKLIRAGIKRMLKNKLLYVCLGVLFFIDGVDIIKEYLTTPHDSLPSPDGYLMSGFLAVFVLAAVLISSFLGSEHSFGTLRNKMTVGHGRLEIYFSSLIVCYTSVMILYAFVWLLSAGLGTLLLGGFQCSPRTLLVKFLVSFMAFTLLTALFVLMALCIHGKSKSSVTAVITAFVMMFTGVATIQMLSQPEYFPASEFTEEQLQGCKLCPDDPSLVVNPDYVTGSKRTMFLLAYDLCPASQILGSDEELPAKNVVIPLCEFAVFLAAGTVIFKKRDIK